MTPTFKSYLVVFALGFIVGLMCGNGTISCNLDKTSAPHVQRPKVDYK